MNIRVGQKNFFEIEKDSSEILQKHLKYSFDWLPPLLAVQQGQKGSGQIFQYCHNF